MVFDKCNSIYVFCEINHILINFPASDDMISEDLMTERRCLASYLSYLVGPGRVTTIVVNSQATHNALFTRQEGFGAI